jgi:MFS family permease
MRVLAQEPEAMAEPRAATGGDRVKPDWLLVGLLWVAFFLNQADRQAFNVVIPLIRADLQLSSQAVGLIATLFTIVYGLLVPVAGLAGDYFSRQRVIVFSLLLFSSGTLLTGLGSSFIMLLLFRSLATGAGEAFYTPAAASMISVTHVQTRARAMAIHQTANYTGIVFGSFLAGWIADQLNWRATFILFGLAGIAWSGVLFVATRRYPRLQQRDTDRAGAQIALIRRSIALIRTNRVIAAQLVAFGGLIFATTGFLTWAPSLLYERFDLPLASAGFASVFSHFLLAYVGVILAGIATDRLVGRFPRIRLVSMALGLMLCAPFIWWSSFAGGLWDIYLAFGLFGLFRGIYDASLFTALLDEVDDDLRSTMIGVLLAGGFLIGASAPLLLGSLKDSYGLDGGLKLLALAALVAGGVLFAATLSRRRIGREA